MKSMNQFFHEKPVKNFMQTMDDFFKNPFPFATSFHIEVNENADDYIIKAELPGINREQIELNAINNYIKITIHRLDIETSEDDLQQVYQKNKHSNNQQGRSPYLLLSMKAPFKLLTPMAYLS